MTAKLPRTAPWTAPVLLIGLDSLTGLQTARLLAARHVPVIAFAKDPTHYCCQTRVCPPPIVVDTDSEALISELERLGPALGERGVLVPCTDLSVLQISEHRDRLADWFHVALPKHDTVQCLLNKARFVEFAQEHEIPIPPSYVLRNPSDVERAAAELTFPCALKPAVKRPAWQTMIREKAIVLNRAAELREHFARVRPFADELVVQQWIAGPLTNQFTCNAYFDRDSQPLVTFVTRKLRQWPPGAGIGCLSEEARDDEVEQETLRLFQRASFRGLAYLEMKRDERDGRCYVVEPNVGRPTGRAAAAEAGGVELLMTAYCDALELPLPAARNQQFTAAKWIYRRRDVQAAWKLWRQGELSGWQWWKSLRGCQADAVFRWRDWRPFVGDVRRTLQKACGRASAAPRAPKDAQGVPASTSKPITLLRPQEQVRWSD